MFKTKSMILNVFRFLCMVTILSSGYLGQSQIVKPFSERSSVYTPNTKTYNIKGDFTMIGNTNLTVKNVNNNSSNSNTHSIYVDVDGDPSTYNSSSATLILDGGVNAQCTNIVYAGLYWSGRAEQNVSNKNKVKIKKAGGSYQTITANSSDILYPNSNYGRMYVGYSEITEFVKNNGQGEYFVADLALSSGNGSSTGFYGSWGMVVIYENASMPWKDITMFDGYAYVAGSVTANYELPIQGFNAAQAGDVNIKLGIMAGEGDRTISGDYLQIHRPGDDSWVSLSHSGNSTNNFFNSSIQTGGNPRNPSYTNNTGIDIAMFDIPNDNNSIIPNGANSTKFRYGSTQDTYIIYNLVLGIDAYNPEVEAFNSITQVNGQNGSTTTIEPNQEVEYQLEIRNRGSEALENVTVDIPVPYNATFVGGSIQYYTHPSVNTSGNPYFNAVEGPQGTIKWNIGDLPLPNDPNTVLARVKYKLKVTTDCFLLAGSNCSVLTNITVNGVINGNGAISGIPLNNRGFVYGYENNDFCSGNPILTPAKIDIIVGDFCNQYDIVPLVFLFCEGNVPTNSQLLTLIRAEFPLGTRFYADIDDNGVGIGDEFNESNPFPNQVGENIFYAIPPGANSCFYEFKIEQVINIESPTVLDNDEYHFCVGEQSVPISIAPTSPHYNVYYYDALDSNGEPTGPANNVIITNTAVSGVYTYYATQGTNTCQGDYAVITVYVHEYPSIVLPSALGLCLEDDHTISVESNISDLQYYFLSNGVWTDLSQLSGVEVVNGDIVITNATMDLNGVSIKVEGSNNKCETTSNILEISVEDCCSFVVECDNLQPLQFNCINDLPQVSSITMAEFTAMGGFIDQNYCESIYISISDDNYTDCSVGFNRYYTISEYIDANGNGVLDSGETVLNSTQCSQQIIISEKVISFNEVLPLGLTAECSNIPMASVLTATDNCGSVLVSFIEDILPGNCSGEYTIKRTWIADNGCSDIIEHIQLINVVDTIPPSFVEILPVDLTVECNSIPVADILTATDNCGVANVSFSETIVDGSCTGEYTIEREWTAIDDCGNEISHTQTIQVVDTSAPVFVETLPLNLTVDCGSVPVAEVLTATDNCSTASVNFIETITDGACENEYTITRTWSAVDDCGNETFHTQVIQVEDNNDIHFIGDLPSDLTVDCNSIPTMEVLTAGGICGVINYTTTESVSNETCTGTYTLTRTWTAVAECSNKTINHTQVIQVVDTTAPVFVETLPLDITVECGNIPTAEVLTATDACGVATVDFTENIVNGNCSGEYTIIRTWVATDDCGNGVSHTQTIQVVDTTAPIFNEVLPTDLTVECSSIPVADILTATDNCSVATVDFTEVIDYGNCSGNYTIIRTWVATDECGNETTHTQTIQVVDTTTPSFVENLPVDLVVECDAIPEAVVLTATHPCTTNLDVLFTETITDGNCSGNYTITRTWVASNDCGNEVSHTQTIQVVDTTAPVFDTVLPVDLTVECDSIPEADFVGAMDNCSVDVNIEFTETITEGDCLGNYTIIRTWVASDDCGNEISHTQNIQVVDTTSPTFNEVLPTDLTVECSSIPVAEVLTATDNCSTASVDFTESITEGNCLGNYTIIRTWVATDDCGNETVHTQTIEVVDTTAPTFNEVLPTDLTVNCGSVPVAEVLTATDNCSVANVDFTETTTEGSCSTEYTITRTWTTTDDCGNETSHTQIIEVVDNNDIYFVGDLPTDLTTECIYIPAMVDLTAEGICGAITYDKDESITEGNCLGEFTITRTWTATAICSGKTITHTAIINVIDTTAPIFVEVLPTDLTVDCGNIPTPDVLTATDNCGVANVDFTETIVNGNCSANYTIIRTWVASDDCGNETIHIQNIQVVDTTAPVFVEVLPTDLTVECNSIPVADILTATDDCGVANVSFSETIIDGNCFDNYTLVRTWIAMDDCGNETVHTQTIQVVDTTAPIFVEVLPVDLTVECSSVPVAETLTATDNCSTDIVVDFSENIVNGNCSGEYTIIRTWTATDDCGNETTHTQTIEVVDTTAPVFVEALPVNLTVECSEVPVAEVLTATDNCSTASIDFTETITEGDCLGEYSITRTWTATDECGNETIHVQTIQVVDTTAPVFVEVLPTDLTVDCGNIPVADVLTASDNCSVANVSFVETTTEGACLTEYTITRTWIATDDCGNETTHIQTIEVVDTTSPTFNEVLPTDITVECSEVPVAEVLTASDNCSVANVDFTETITEGDCLGNYTIVRTWVATDDCGNETNHTQTIQVEDTTAPTFNEVLPTDIIVECSSIPVAEVLTATDNCSVDVNIEFTETITEGDCLGNYTIVRTWVASDDCGNETSHTQTIQVEDTTAPTFNEVLPTDLTVECSEVPVADVLTATDNCSVANVSFVETTTEGDCLGNYTIVRTWVATDDCGNETSHTQTIQVEDTTAPIITPSTDGNIIVECDEMESHLQLFLDNNGYNNASDNCSTDILWTNDFNIDNFVFDCGTTGYIDVIFTATDDCGNASIITTRFTTVDTTAPEFNEVLPTDLTVECSSIPEVDVLTTTDNCSVANVDFTETIIDGNCSGEYMIIRTWVATDDCGNGVSHTQTIQVVDTTAPVFSETPKNFALSCDEEIPSAPILTATDNCSVDIEVIFTEIFREGECENSYIIDRVWVANDDCGNETRHTQSILILDVTPPTFIGELPQNISINCEELTEAPILEAMDNCGEVEVSFEEYTEIGLECDAVNTITRIWTATDSCGNTTRHTQIISAYCSVEVHNGVSANNDGYNDYLNVVGIECYPNNRMEIYNRWGVKVYETRGYDNGLNSFRGYSNGRVNLTNDKLPSGTYFYILDYERPTDGGNESKSGYFQLN